MAKRKPSLSKCWYFTVLVAGTFIQTTVAQEEEYLPLNSLPLNLPTDDEFLRCKACCEAFKDNGFDNDFRVVSCIADGCTLTNDQCKYATTNGWYSHTRSCRVGKNWRISPDEAAKYAITATKFTLYYCHNVGSNTIISTTQIPTTSPTTSAPTKNPTTPRPTKSPSKGPTHSPSTSTPTLSPTTPAPTKNPTTPKPTASPTPNPTRSPTTPTIVARREYSLASHEKETIIITAVLTGIISTVLVFGCVAIRQRTKRSRERNKSKNLDTKAKGAFKNHPSHDQFSSHDPIHQHYPRNNAPDQNSHKQHMFFDSGIISKMSNAARSVSTRFQRTRNNPQNASYPVVSHIETSNQLAHFDMNTEMPSRPLYTNEYGSKNFPPEPHFGENMTRRQDLNPRMAEKNEIRRFADSYDSFTSDEPYSTYPPVNMYEEDFYDNDPYEHSPKYEIYEGGQTTPGFYNSRQPDISPRSHADNFQTNQGEMYSDEPLPPPPPPPPQQQHRGNNIRHGRGGGSYFGDYDI